VARVCSDDEAYLKAMGPRIQPHIHRIIDDFYIRILKHPEARRSIPGGLAQIERLNVTLRRWMEQLFIGPWDEQYYELRAKIGRRHVQINLPQQYMFTAVEVIRGHIHDILFQSSNAETLGNEGHAIDKLLSMELVIMLHTYREDYLAKAQRNERLATFGQLVTSVAHELRNPLAVIGSSLFLLRRRVGDDPKVVSHLDKIEAQLNLSSRIINNMFDMVRERPAKIQPIEPTHMTKTVLESIREEDRSRIQIEVGVLPKVQADEDQAGQILLNLLLNALEASGPKGKVQLTAYQEGANVSFLVNDDGPGIDSNIRDRLFEPLVSTKKSGIGLGLALSRKLAERNGGSLTVQQGPLPGAAFVLALPIL
jgi:two-component system sensor histidine kinase HydH